MYLTPKKNDRSAAPGAAPADAGIRSVKKGHAGDLDLDGWIRMPVDTKFVPEYS
jgi:hypothetical protein